MLIRLTLVVYPLSSQALLGVNREYREDQLRAHESFSKPRSKRQPLISPPRFSVNDPNRWVITLQKRGLVAGGFAAVVG